MRAVETTKHTGQASVEKICQCFSMHRDAYYKLKRRIVKQEAVSSQVIEMVKEERVVQPRVGTRKLHKALQFAFDTSGLKVGRDKMFDILRDHDLLVRRKKASCRTTDS